MKARAHEEKEKRNWNKKLTIVKSIQGRASKIYTEGEYKGYVAETGKIIYIK